MGCVASRPVLADGCLPATQHRRLSGRGGVGYHSCCVSYAIIHDQRQTGTERSDAAAYQLSHFNLPTNLEAQTWNAVVYVATS